MWTSRRRKRGPFVFIRRQVSPLVSEISLSSWSPQPWSWWRINYTLKIKTNTHENSQLPTKTRGKKNLHRIAINIESSKKGGWEFDVKSHFLQLICSISALSFEYSWSLLKHIIKKMQIRRKIRQNCAESVCVWVCARARERDWWKQWKDPSTKSSTRLKISPRKSWGLGFRASPREAL